MGNSLEGHMEFTNEHLDQATKARVEAVLGEMVKSDGQVVQAESVINDRFHYILEMDNTLDTGVADELEQEILEEETPSSELPVTEGMDVHDAEYSYSSSNESKARDILMIIQKIFLPSMIDIYRNQSGYVLAIADDSEDAHTQQISLSSHSFSIYYSSIASEKRHILLVGDRSCYSVTIENDIQRVLNMGENVRIHLLSRPIRSESGKWLTNYILSSNGKERLYMDAELTEAVSYESLPALARFTEKIRLSRQKTSMTLGEWFSQNRTEAGLRHYINDLFE